MQLVRYTKNVGLFERKHQIVQKILATVSIDHPKKKILRNIRSFIYNGFSTFGLSMISNAKIFTSVVTEVECSRNVFYTIK